MRNEKGITIVALVVTIIILLILATVGIQYGMDAIKVANLEDLKANMLLIQGKAKIIIDKENFEDEYNSEGMLKLDTSNNTTGFILTTEFTNVLNNVTDGEFYIWNETALNNNSLANIEITENEFFVIDYNSGEVYFSLGYDGKYSLTEINQL